MSPSSEPSQPEERVAIAKQLLAILAAFGCIAAISDYLVGNLTMAVASAAITVSAPIVLWLGRLPRFARLPLLFCIWLLFGMFVLGSFTQLAFHPEKAVWTVLFPFAYFYLTGLRYGLVLSIISLLIGALAYATSPALMGKVAQLTPYGFSQGIGAFAVSTVLAFFYERIRTRQAERLQTLADRDLLTGLLNRRGFLPQAEATLQQARRFGQTLALLLIDLDNFKQINDRQGHDAGDLLLKEFGTLLTQFIRRADLAARWGGEEFIVVMLQNSPGNMQTAASKLLEVIGAHAFSAGHITASLGVSICESDETLEAAIKRADEAMYRAKQNGKDRVEFAPSGQ